MTDIDTLQEGIEAVARFNEKKSCRRSPFHLAACGGCGGPSFRQPCTLCNFYPMGADKGVYYPEHATKEMFCSMVERSGPGGRGGTIATWHAINNMRRWENREDVARAALEIDVPAASDYWDAVVVDGTSLHRPKSDAFLHFAWTAIGDIGQLVMGEFSNRQPSTRSTEVHAAFREWIDAVHSDDREGIAKGLEKLQTEARLLSYEYPRNGNLIYARENLTKAVERFEADHTAAFAP